MFQQTQNYSNFKKIPINPLKILHHNTKISNTTIHSGRTTNSNFHFLKTRYQNLVERAKLDLEKAMIQQRIKQYPRLKCLEKNELKQNLIINIFSTRNHEMLQSQDTLKKIKRKKQLKWKSIQKNRHDQSSFRFSTHKINLKKNPYCKKFSPSQISPKDSILTFHTESNQVNSIQQQKKYIKLKNDHNQKSVLYHRCKEIQNQYYYVLIQTDQNDFFVCVQSVKNQKEKYQLKTSRENGLKILKQYFNNQIDNMVAGLSINVNKRECIICSHSVHKLNVLDPQKQI